MYLLTQLDDWCHVWVHTRFVTVTSARGGGGANAAKPPEGEKSGENTAVSSSAADESARKGEGESGADAGQLPLLDEEAAATEEAATIGAKGGGEEERALLASNTRPRLPSDAQDKRGRKNARKGRNKRKKK